MRVERTGDGVTRRMPVLKVGLGDLTPTPRASVSERSDDGNSMRKVLAETEREQIVRPLEQANWVISGAAARLGM